MQVNMKDSKGRNRHTVCNVFLPGSPHFSLLIALVTFLVDEGQMTDDEKVILIGMGMLPWMIGKVSLDH